MYPNILRGACFIPTNYMLDKLCISKQRQGSSSECIVPHGILLTDQQGRDDIPRALFNPRRRMYRLVCPGTDFRDLSVIAVEFEAGSTTPRMSVERISINSSISEDPAMKAVSCLAGDVQQCLVRALAWNTGLLLHPYVPACMHNISHLNRFADCGR